MRTRTMTAAMLAVVLGLTGCSSSGGDDDVAVADAGPGGIDATTYPDATGVPAFRVQFVDPDRGAFSGGTEAMVRGNGFTSSSSVYFGGRQVEPLDVQFIDSRRITVRTPPGQPGLVDVEVRNGSEIAQLSDGYTYEAIEVDPPSGSVAGGTYVTIEGFGTNFQSGLTTVTFDGVPMVDLVVVNDQQITGRTPPGTAGSADVRVQTALEVQEAQRAYTYLATADPFFGGMGGGPINGTLNVVVLDSNTGDGIPDAYVAVGDPTTTPYQGTADNLGQITFSAPGLVGPVTVHATADGYDFSSFVKFDATDISIFLRKPPEPVTGPIPPPRQLGRVHGHILFGDATAIGSPHWNLVPEPRTPTEVKRIYVTTTSPNVFSTSFAPSGSIDYAGYDPNTTAWAYDVIARPSALAVVAVAGLYDPAQDPSGAGVTGFEPFAMGVRRGVLVGPGEDVMNVDVVINIPLDTAVQVNLDRPTPLNTPGWTGPTYYSVRPYIDLGGEGVIHMNKNGLPSPPQPELVPNVFVIPDGQQSILMPKMAPLVGPLADASYSFVAAAFSPNDTNPYSVRIARGYSDVSAPVVIGDFLGMPRPVDPAPNSLASGAKAVIAPEGPSTGEGTFNLFLFRSAAGDDLARIFTRGDVFEAEIPDFTGVGFPAFPANEDVAWTFYRITVSGATFDTFRYSHLSALYWSAYAADAYWVQFPP